MVREKVAVEVETGKSNIKANLNKIEKAGFDRIILVATSATAVTSCQKVIGTANRAFLSKIELLNIGWTFRSIWNLLVTKVWID